MDGMLHTMPFSQVYTLACKYIFSYYIQHRSNVRSREELKEAGPKPGGFRCVLEEESADILFYSLTLDGKVVWASRDE